MRRKVDGETSLVKKSEQDVCPGATLSLLLGIFDNCLLRSFNRSRYEICSRAGALSTDPGGAKSGKIPWQSLVQQPACRGPLLLPDLASVARLGLCCTWWHPKQRAGREGLPPFPHLGVVSLPSRSVCACEALGDSSPALPMRKEV